jgi:chromate reductase, NAD(P)H dehydrogenase (quinone)
MTEKKKIIALSGSIKNGSMNVKIIEKFAELTHEFFEITLFPIGELPHFNPDLETPENLPKSVINLRNAIENADGVFISTPEYVFSIPAILKNAIEWTVSTVVFNEKPTAIITASTVGEKTHESLHLVMTTVGAKIGDKSALLIKNVKSKINPSGEFINAETLSEFNDLINDFKDNLMTK